MGGHAPCPHAMRNMINLREYHIYLHMGMYREQILLAGEHPDSVSSEESGVDVEHILDTSDSSTRKEAMYLHEKSGVSCMHHVVGSAADDTAQLDYSKNHHQNY